MLDERIRFDERYDSIDNNTTTLYFKAPRELLAGFVSGDYPDAISMEISVEIPSDHIDPDCAYVCVSPTRKCDGGTEDYDWSAVSVPCDEVEALIKLAGKG